MQDEEGNSRSQRLARLKESFDRTSGEVFLRLGQLLVQANVLEDGLVELYWIVTQRPRAAVVAEVRMWMLGVLGPKVIAMFRQQVSEPTLLSRVALLEPRLLAAIQTRNAFVHASWWISSNGYATRGRRPRDRVEEETVLMRPEHIEAAGREIGMVASEVWDLIEATVVAMGGDYPPNHGETRDGVTYPSASVVRDVTK